MLGNAYGATHGGSKTPEYRSWKGMKERCLNPNIHNYPSYGGRGIKVCDRWLTFVNFLEDMGRKPTPDHSIDRIDVDGNYEPSNCRWATASEQQQNKRPMEKRDVCIRGHVLAEVGTYATGNRGHRTCKKCSKDRALARHYALKVARP